jgi:hypothetical protein
MEERKNSWMFLAVPLKGEISIIINDFIQEQLGRDNIIVFCMQCILEEEYETI